LSALFDPLRRARARVSAKRVDLGPLRQWLVRLDFVVGEFASKATKRGAEIPRLLLSLSMHNAALQAGT
jgi:hypothetical protein